MSRFKTIELKSRSRIVTFYYGPGHTVHDAIAFATKNLYRGYDVKELCAKSITGTMLTAGDPIPNIATLMIVPFR